MVINVRCSCGKVLKAPGQLAGTRARCPSCGVAIDIPPNTAGAGASLQQAASSPATQPATSLDVQTQLPRKGVDTGTALSGQNPFDSLRQQLKAMELEALEQERREELERRLENERQNQRLGFLTAKPQQATTQPQRTASRQTGSTPRKAGGSTMIKFGRWGGPEADCPKCGGQCCLRAVAGSAGGISGQILQYAMIRICPACEKPQCFVEGCTKTASTVVRYRLTFGSGKSSPHMENNVCLCQEHFALHKLYKKMDLEGNALGIGGVAAIITGICVGPLNPSAMPWCAVWLRYILAFCVGGAGIVMLVTSVRLLWKVKFFAKGRGLSIKQQYRTYGDNNPWTVY
jgi:hypothetical protein